MDNIYVGCHRCGNKNVDVMSVRKDKTKYQDKTFPTAIITYICCNCGWSEEDRHYLYGEE